MTARRGGGFWRGFLVGLVLSLLIGLILAWAFPPLHAPDVDEALLATPDGPGAPAAVGRPGGATPEAELPGHPLPPAAPAPKPEAAP
ncbi:hypothetical protein HNP73_001446 [Amaricoccus macauensis]|uniref:Uncharacterized protein n=1 Tax=Amaricoccus macauensis TaxID=57001 RepID=A0A840SLN6_9RHOB|nr:hypothetical protein [Amaricoccus macauensis]MBB5221525.1 hypothetical protein [Amaricoccus macauensis]